MIGVALLLLLAPQTEPANILVTAPFPGSHYFAMANIGLLLAEQGHQVTFLSLAVDNRITVEHENFHMLQPLWEILTADEFDEICYNCVTAIVQKGKSYDMYADTMVSDPECRVSWLRLYRKLIDYYTSVQFEDVLATGKFDLILEEERTSLPILAVTNIKWLDIPHVVYSPEISYHVPREALNLPMFLSSEPGLCIQIFNKEKPGFWYRLSGLANMAIGAIQLHSAIHAMLEPAFAKYKVKSVESLFNRLQLFVMNDHIAFSFPYQLPNNLVQVGGSSLKEGSPLSGEIKVFVEKQSLPIILVSMGTYTDLTWLHWHTTLIGVLEESDVSVILKIHESTRHKLPTLSEKFYLSTWIPQRDLLASGQIKLFVSHCGNNGRIETIYHRVPVLCVPVFADQTLNGELVVMRGFGEMIISEEMTRDNIKEVLSKMLVDHDTYAGNMEIAVDIFKSEPTSGTEKLMYYMNLLLKYKNLDHLTNHIMKKQSALEIYNLDVVLFVICVMGLLCFVAFRLVKAIIIWLINKRHVKKD